MKIDLELPEWAEKRHMYVMSGIELIAYKHRDENWKMKIGRCNSCGGCCKAFRKKPSASFPPIFNGTCVYLKKVGKVLECSLGVNRPFRCCAVPSPKGVSKCTEKFNDEN